MSHVRFDNRAAVSYDIRTEIIQSPTHIMAARSMVAHPMAPQETNQTRRGSVQR